MGYDIWVDFNDLGMVGAFETTSLLKYAPDHDKIRPDHRVIAGDSEGNTCQAVVQSVNRRTGIVRLFLFIDTFKAVE